jgi:hypothetical protein
MGADGLPTETRGESACVGWHDLCSISGDHSFFYREYVMPKFVVEREIPGIGEASPQDLKEISQKSREVLNEMGTSIQWVESYVTGNKIYCVYIAENAQQILDHAEKGGFPANQVNLIENTINPTTAE